MIENQTFSLDEVEAGESYKNCQFTYSSEIIHVSDVTFERCEFQNQEFQRSEWLDCTFKDIIFSNLSFSESVFYRCRFEHCQLLGTNFIDNRWKETRISDSRCDYINFSESVLEKCFFENTSLKEAYFQSLTVKKSLVFDSCQLEQADFLGTKLATIDFSKSEFENIVFSPNLLKGAIISHYQAAQMIGMLGVKIK